MWGPHEAQLFSSVLQEELKRTQVFLVPPSGVPYYPVFQNSSG